MKVNLTSLVREVSREAVIVVNGTPTLDEYGLVTYNDKKEISTQIYVSEEGGNGRYDYKSGTYMPDKKYSLYIVSEVALNNNLYGATVTLDNVILKIVDCLLDGRHSSHAVYLAFAKKTQGDEAF